MKKTATKKKPSSKIPINSTIPRPEEPEVFRYWDGSRVRGVDTFKALTKLKPLINEELLKEFAVLEQLGDEPTDEQIEQINKFTDLFRPVLQIPTFEEFDGVKTGLTDTEAFGAVASFLVYLVKMKPLNTEEADAKK